MAIRFDLLHTFVVVARERSMKAAAERLSVTPGAISQRIRLLEEAAGQRLFVRGRDGVRLASKGETLFAALDAPFHAIEAADRGLGKNAARRVVVSMMSSFASGWLVPRLGRFARRHPDIEVVVETGPRLVDLAREPVDMAIRHGLGNYPGLDATKLIAPELVVVASPRLLRSGPPLAAPADCLRYTLLHDIDRGDWPLWFEAQGVAVPKRLKGPSFSDDHLVVRAAVAGQGLALVRDVYAQDELRSGRLVKALKTRWPARFAYYAVTRAGREHSPALRHFKRWLVEEAKRDRR
ncbi:LysR substrate-binding domain-containing protein [Enhydrobacter aerosaccus]|uniref:LysR substrate-binding domain-containing protein n=1 Tax=Enhydrobacter aerosaccus TaxID=225324 RepID=UPI001C47750F|nr:LysR substrate-binding domain-containing protein [Enhydrobacter aerosaccus]